MKFILLFSLILISSCTKKNGLNNGLLQQSNSSTQSINLTSSVVFDQDRELHQDETQIIDFETVKENHINIQRIYLKNNYIQSLAIDLSIINSQFSGSAFSFEKSDCPTNLINGDICFIDIKLVNDSTLSYSPLSLDLTNISQNSYFGKITLVGQRGISNAVKNYQFVNIGQVINIENSNKYVRIYIKNEGDKIINPVINVPQEYSISKSDCSGLLQKSKVCFLDLKINNTLDPNIIGVNKPIVFDGINFSITAGVSAPNNSITCSALYTNINNTCNRTSQVRACLVQPEHSSQGFEETLNGGQTWTSCSSYQCNELYTNIGGACVISNQDRSCAITNGDGTQHSSDGGLSYGLCNVLSCHATFMNVSNTCVSINQNRACTIQNGIGSQSSVDGGQTYNNCSVVSCNSDYTHIANSCIISNQDRACTIANGLGSQHSIDGGQSYGICAVISCSTLYTNVANTCVLSSQDRSCTISNGTGSQHSSDGGVNYGICNVVNCNATYSNVANVCVVTNQTRACASQPQNSNGGFESTVNGGVNWSVCTSYSCNTNYTNVSGICVQTNQSRICNNQPSNSNGGFEYSTNGGVSYGTCTDYTCDSGYALDNSTCKIAIKSTGTSRSWSDNSYAKSCNEYRNPLAGYTYKGLTGDGIYKIKPDSGAAYDAFCDMTTSGGGWTQVMNLEAHDDVYGWDNVFWTNAVVLNDSIFNSPNTQSKYKSFNNLSGTNLLLRSYQGTAEYVNYTGLIGSSKTMYQIMQSSSNTIIGDIAINAVQTSTYGPYGTNYFRIGRNLGNQYYQNIGWGTFQTAYSCGQHSGGNWGINSFTCQSCSINNVYGYCYDNSNLWNAQVFIK